MAAGSAAAAARLGELHASTRPLVLPTVWDAWSAKVAVGVGFAALTVGSHPLAVFEKLSGSRRDDLALLGLFLGRIRDDDTAAHGLLLFNTANEHAVMEGSKRHATYSTAKKSRAATVRE